MSVTSLYTPDLLASYQELTNRFFHTHDQLDALVSNTTTRTMSYWNVTWILGTSVVRIPFFIFLQATAWVLSCLSLRNIANRVYVYSGHSLNQIMSAFAKLQWGTQLLVPAYNDYQISHWDLYSRGKIRRSDIPDPNIRNALHEKIKKVDFSARIGKGLCHGGVSWFNNLFLQGLEGSTLALNSPTFTEYGKKIASLFANGAPKEAAIIQSLYGIEKTLFPIKEIPIEVELKIESLKNLCDGVFYVNTDEHALSYVKQNDEQFIWDPTVGLIAIKKTEELLSILKPYAKDSVRFIYQSLERKSLFTKICSLLRIR